MLKDYVLISFETRVENGEGGDIVGGERTMVRAIMIIITEYVMRRDKHGLVEIQRV